MFVYVIKVRQLLLLKIPGSHVEYLGFSSRPVHTSALLAFNWKFEKYNFELIPDNMPLMLSWNSSCWLEIYYGDRHITTRGWVNSKRVLKALSLLF
jgi:hypothetical protein